MTDDAGADELGADELELLRRMFSDAAGSSAAPDAHAWESVRARVKRAADDELATAPSWRAIRRRPRGAAAWSGRRPAERWAKIGTAALAIAVTAGAVTAGAVLASIGPGPRHPSPPPGWRVVSTVRPVPFRAAPDRISFANHVTCPASKTCFLMATVMNPSTYSAAAANLYSSSDGGAHWRRLPLPRGAMATTGLSCTSPTSCAAGGLLFPLRHPGAGRASAPRNLTSGKPVLLTTANGGASWSTQAVPVPSARPPGGGGSKGGTLRGRLSAVSCPAARTCMGTAFAYLDRPGWPSMTEDLFLRSIDGGRSWASQVLPGQPGLVRSKPPIPPPLVLPAVLRCPTARECVVMATARRSGQPLPTLETWRTVNAGATWSRSTLPEGLSGTYSTAFGKPSCPDAAHCWVLLSRQGAAPAGRSGEPVPGTTLASTGNGGRTWRLHRLPGTGRRGYWASLSCTAPGTCWLGGSVNGRASLMVTRDGGRRWSGVPLPPKAQGSGSGSGSGSANHLYSIHRISCRPGGSCIALASRSGPAVAGSTEAVLTNG
ncbi:MAG: beta propeller repeat protein [Acidimicrobiales bacterium]